MTSKKGRTDVTIDHGRLRDDYGRAKKEGPDALGRFAELCKTQRQKWETLLNELKDMDWTEISHNTAVGKQLLGRLRNLFIMSNDVEKEIGGYEKTVHYKDIDGPMAEARRTLDALERGESTTTTHLERWQGAIRAQAEEAVETLAEFEKSANQDRRQIERKYKYSG